MPIPYITKDKSKIGKLVSGFPKTQSQMAQYQRDYLLYSGKWYEKASTPAQAPITSPADKQSVKKPTLDTIGAGVSDVATRTKDLIERVKTEGITDETGKVLKAGTKTDTKDTDKISDTLDIDRTSEIDEEVSSEDLEDANKPIPTTPDPQADIITNTYITGLIDDLSKKRKTLDDRYQKQLDDLAKQKTEYETKIADIETKQEDLIETDIEPLLSPFRENLEKSERERLKIEENFFANQKSIEELETLLTQAQAEIKTAEEKTGLSAIRQPRIAKIKEDMIGRVGIIEAVMAVRNNQINVAENMIDRSINAITADRNDKLTYYNTLYNFYENQKDAEGNKLFTLEKNEKDIINNQISLLENDLVQSQATTDYVKGMMLDPRTADIMEQAGVKLNDTTDDIQQKLSDYTYRQEKINLDNKMEESGYEYIPNEVLNKPENEIIRMTDSRGVERAYWKEAEAPTYTPPNSYKEWELAGGEAGTGYSYADWLNETGKTDIVKTIDGVAFEVNGKGYAGLSGIKDFLVDNPDTTYDDMLLQLKEKYPSISTSKIKDALDMSGYRTKADIEKEEEERKEKLEMNYDINFFSKIIKEALADDYELNIMDFMRYAKESFKDMTDRDKEVIKKLFLSEQKMISGLDKSTRKKYFKLE